MERYEEDLLKSLLTSLTLKELRPLAKKHGLVNGGNKLVLIERIIDSYKKSLIEYNNKLEKLNVDQSIVPDIKNFISKIYAKDDRLMKSIKKIITSESEYNDIIDYLNLKSEVIVDFNDSSAFNELLNALKKYPKKKELFYRHFFPIASNVEELENKYLNLYYYHFLFYRDEILKGLKTGLEIEKDWEDKWDITDKISTFAVGAERVIYALINGRGIGNPNSAPVGSDLFFEVEDAYIHIDLKTISTKNIGDFITDIPVGNNQNSYNGKIKVDNKIKEYDEANIPHFYSTNNKVSLTYFITILYEEKNLDIINIMFLSMPNGYLYDIYGPEILNAGKIHYKKGNPKRDTHARTIRYNWSESVQFETLAEENRVKVIYSNEEKKYKYLDKLSLIHSIHNSQKIK